MRNLNAKQLSMHKLKFSLRKIFIGHPILLLEKSKERVRSDLKRFKNRVQGIEVHDAQWKARAEIVCLNIQTFMLQPHCLQLFSQSWEPRHTHTHRAFSACKDLADGQFGKRVQWAVQKYCLAACICEYDAKGAGSGDESFFLGGGEEEEEGVWPSSDSFSRALNGCYWRQQRLPTYSYWFKTHTLQSYDMPCWTLSSCDVTTFPH